MKEVGAMSRSWTAEEDAFLRANYATTMHKDIGAALGKGEAAVRNRCWRLRLAKGNRPWSDDEDKALRSIYQEAAGRELVLDQVARRMGRARWGVAMRASRLGLSEVGRPPTLQAVVKLMRNPNSFRGNLPGRMQTVGGFREDIGIYVRSRWEANYARYLNWLVEHGEIRSWEYEADTFEFPVKRGNRFYTPDFKVTENNGLVVYHEVKGYMTDASRVKLSRMARYYPQHKVLVIGGATMADIRRKIGGMIPNWETSDSGTPPGGRTEWTPQEMMTLARQWGTNVPAAMIAAELGRTLRGTKAMANRLGLRRTGYVRRLSADEAGRLDVRDRVYRSAKR